MGKAFLYREWKSSGFPEQGCVTEGRLTLDSADGRRVRETHEVFCEASLCFLRVYPYEGEPLFPVYVHLESVPAYDWM